MHTPMLPNIVRRFLARGLATGLLVSQSALLLPAQTSPASNTTASGETVVLETYKVTAGFSGSLAAAAEMKQNQKVITEVITSEDIGKLPDISIADALTRLTGLTTQRTNGRSQAISIRGLTGDFSTGLLNGREQVSTGLNRAVEFDQYPADLLSTVVVYKTAAPSLVGQGLAGTIDLQTLRPLSRSGRVIAANGYYEWNQLGALTPSARATGNRFNLSYIDQNKDGTMGIAVGYSHSSKPFAGQQYQAWGFDQPGGNYLLGGTKSYVRNSVLDRDGIMLVLENKPNENIHSTIDVYVSDFEENQLLRGMEIPLAPNWTSWTGNGTTLVSGTTTGGYYSQAVIGNVQPVVRNDTFVRTDKPLSVGWNLVIGEKSAWPITFDAGYSRVTRDDINLETYSGLGFRDQPGPTPDTMTVRLIPGEMPVITSTLDYASGSILRLTDPQGWGSGSLPGGGMYGYYKGFKSKDELGQVKLFTQHELTRFFSKMELGLSYTDRYKRDGETPSGWIHSPTAAVTLPLPASVGTTDMGFLGLGKIYAFDPLAAFENGVYGFTSNNDTGIVAKRFHIREKLTQAYAQFEIDRKMGEMPVTGNVGFRFISTKQTSNGLSGNGNNLNAVTDGDSYTQFSPSLNLNFEPRKDTYIRFSLARQIARPRMYDMRASRSWGYDPTKTANTSVSQSPWSGGGGNSRLRPWESDSIDLSFEKYFKNNKGYVALAGFNKKLRNYIYEESSVGDFSGYPITSGGTPALRQGVVTQPVNGTGGNIKGLEFTLSLASEMLSNNIRGFGLVLGGAYTKSSVKPWGPTGADAPIGGLSEKVANVTFYYERHGFSARVSDRYRSSNRQYITTFGAPQQGGDVNPNGGFSVAQPENVLDAQVSYTFNRGPVEGLSVFIQAYNLGNEPLITYDNDDPRRVINYQKYGASYSFGAAYKF